jgi:mutator protein MutT
MIFKPDPKLAEALKKITAACQPFWRFRDNDVHILESTRFAEALLVAHPEADAEIVLPAILMHDNGFANVPPETLLVRLKDAAVGLPADVTRLHEIEGAKIAREILESIQFNPAKITKICEIIGGHDSREEALSLEDQLVKDADKLWRYTVIAADVAGRGWLELSHEKFNADVTARIDQWMFTETAKKLAWETTTETQAQLRNPPEGAAFMLIRDGKLLVEKRRPDKRLLPNAISIPGGHNDPGESAEQTLMRELKEELGLETESYKFVCTLIHFDQEIRKLSYFAVEAWSGEMVMNEAADLRWIDLDDLEELDVEVDRIAVQEFKRVYG